mgnify:CR=1 FL=1
MRSNIGPLPQRFRKAALSAVLVLSALAAPAARAEPPVLGLPVACALGETCWLVNFVDRDPGPAARDYRCGGLSYDTHKGTDFAIRSDAAMRAGVDVLAAAPGTVRAVRDGMPDSSRSDLESGTVRGRECGNGVYIDHADGWSTQYCHMQAGSVRVRAGDTVARGQVIGRIGRSGRSEFPHIHMTLRDGARVVDPFTGDSAIAACDAGAGAVPAGGLWDPALTAQLAYPGPQPFHTGFATGRPKKADIEAGRLSETAFPPDTAALVFWAEAFSLEKGDRIHIMLTAPGGGLVAENRVTLDRPLAKGHWYAGRKKRGAAWATGSYTGRIAITRGGETVERSAVATVE